MHKKRVDGSTFTVGPGSDLVFDKFVHNPSKNRRDCRHEHHDGLLQQSFCVRAIQAALNLSPQFNLGFGGNGRSTFIDDKNFAAIAGVIGNFGLGNSSCQATGIFGAPPSRTDPSAMRSTPAPICWGVTGWMPGSSPSVT
jgi:hypothetical protein